MTESNAEQPVGRHHSLLGGREEPGRAGVRPVVNPASGRPFAEVSLLDAEQASTAVARAEAAFASWSRTSFRDRRRLLLGVHRHLIASADSLAQLVSREQGKPLAEARMAEVLIAAESLKHLSLHAEDALREDTLEPQALVLAHKECRITYAPLGVVLIITPWNYPFSIAMSNVAAALAAGNTVVLKAAPAASLIGLQVGALFAKAGLPEGALSVVLSNDDVAQTLVDDPRVAKIVFTGSVATGKRIMARAAENLTPVVLELGGKDPAIVCRDASLERAVAGVVFGAFLNAGQSCASVERVYVERPIAEEFLRRVVEQARALRMGDPFDADTDVGPLTLERQRAVVEAHVQDALARGARALTGGQRPDGDGWFYPPTVLTGVDHSMRVMREETFGPVLPVMTVDSFDEALTLANDSPYGLTASVWTRAPEHAQRAARELRAGSITINDCLVSFGEPTAPWGGFKQSGIGRTHGLLGLREMVQVQHVADDWSRRPALWWYPYDREYRDVMEVALKALHGASFWTRIVHQLRLLGFRRVLRRINLFELLRNPDKLF